METNDFALGPLEIACLEAMWLDGALDARSLHDRFSRERRLSLSTVQSTLERLHRKGLVSRTKVSHAYVYAAELSREAVMARLVDVALKPFASAPGQGLLAAFAEYAAAADDAALDELERLIAERKAALARKQERR
ncbi:MAG: BlaI/MecI/CopY family transcriptional regulator [Gammaproteobacteria bacterium]